MSNLISCFLYNAIVLICFTVLVVLFHKWWIVLFSVLFILVWGKKMTPQQWRRTHKACRWCEYSKYVCPTIIAPVGCSDYYMCKVKDKKVYETFPAPFCRLYKPKEFNMSPN